jgi:Zn-dependent metalloprotease
MSRSVKTLAFLLAAGPLSLPLTAQAPRAPRPASSQDSSRIQEARALLLGPAAAFRLGPQDDFQHLNTVVNAQGEPVLRFVQTHRGVPVNGTMAVVRLGKAPRITARHVEPGIQLPASQPGLSAEQALAIVHRDLTPTVAYAQQPTVEPVVFPTRLVGHVLPKKNEATGSLRPDPLTSVSVGSVSAPHVWGYHVTRQLMTPEGKLFTFHAVVDGDSCLILRKWNNDQGDDPIASGLLLPPATDYVSQAERLTMPIRVEGRPAPAAKPMLAAAPAVTAPAYLPAVGVAKTQFLGDVAIPTVFDPVNNGYGLLDLQRGAGGHLYTDLTGYTPGNRILTDELFNIGTTPEGFTFPYYRSFMMEDGPSKNGELTGSLNNVWGNGQDYVRISYSQSPFTEAGKTAAGEAMYAVTTTYDVMDKILGRKSFDGLDTSILVVANVKYMMGKAMWAQDTGWLEIGWGDPNGWGSVHGVNPVHSGAELTNIAHELGVAMYQSTVPYTMSYSRERSLLERSTGALIAQMAEAYAQRQPGDPDNALPAVPVDWTFGRTRMDNRPWFWMHKPSKDGRSPDAYFDGIWMVGDSYFDTFNFGSGPMNRAWYFLSEGASALPSSEAYSPYLPQGMSGIGLPKTAAIAYKALTDYYTDETGYDQAREACIQAAGDLYGLLSPEAAAVAKAFAAINVGTAPGQPATVRVSFEGGLLAPGTALSGYYPLEHFMIAPVGQWIPIKGVKVENATNPAIEWKAESVPGIMTTWGGTTAQGAFNAQGFYRAPDKAEGYWGVQAWSKQDPRQFAQGVVWALATDGNGDGDFDALDFADYAMLCYLPYNFKDALNPWALYGPHSQIGDPDIQVVVQAFNNAFNF